MGQYTHPLVVSLSNPIRCVKGSANFAEILPVIAKTIKMAIISHLWLTTHLFSSFLKHQRKKRNRGKYKRAVIPSVKGHSNAVLFNEKRCSSLLEMIYAVPASDKKPRIGNTSCQFLEISQRCLTRFIGQK